MQFVKPIPFKEAVAKLGSRSPIGAALSSGQWAGLPLALRDRAFFSANVEDVRLLQDMKNFLNDFLDENRDPNAENALKTGSKAKFIEQARRKAIEYGIPVDPKDAGSIRDITSEKRLGLIFDTQRKMATAYGDFLQGMDPDVLNEFPAQRFIRVREVQSPRDPHQIVENTVQLKTNLEFWIRINEDFGTPYGPWGWGCGHDVEDVDRDEAEELGLLTADTVLQPALQDFNDKLKASVSNLDPEFLAALKSKLGDKVMIKDGAVWWKGDRAGKKTAGVAPAKKSPSLAPQSGRGQGEGNPAPFPESLSDLESVKSLGGSTGAELMRDKKTGGLFVLKRGASAAHVREEFAADQLYRSQGVPVPEAKLFDGAKPAKLARFVEGEQLGAYLQKATAAQKAATLAEVKKHFSVDVLLGNWDVAGLNFDNIIVDKAGVPWRIDNGGALRFRAMGANKGADWNAFPTELWSLRNAAENAQTAKLFGDLDIYSLARQANAIDLTKLLAVAPENVRDVLRLRAGHLIDVARKAVEYEQSKFVAAYADEVTKHIIGLRQAGALEKMAPALKQTHPGDVRPVDAEGRAFDLLRTAKGKVVADPSQAFFDDILAAVKTVNAHHAKGDTSYNTAKLEKAAGHKIALQHLANTGSAAEKSMAARYLSTLEAIDKAQGDKLATIPTFSKFALPPSKGSKAARSVVAEVADYMEKHGGDWKVIERWAGAQAGSSASTSSQALKRWLFERLQGLAEADFRVVPSASALASDRAHFGAKYDRSFEIFHAFVQEVLLRLDFAGNDRVARRLRVLRTEGRASVIGLKKGKKGRYTRGVNESGSVFAPALHSATTITSVPHPRITGLYFFEQRPGSGATFYLGDNENEVTYMAHELDTLYAGDRGAVNLSPGTDSSKWEL